MRARQDPVMSATVETMRGTRSSCSAKISSGSEGAVVGLGPQMGAGTRVDELHRDAQRRSRLAQAPLHHVAGAELLADGAHVGRLAGERVELRATTRRYEKRESPVTISSESPSASAVRSASAPRVLERQHRDPEAFVDPGRARSASAARPASAPASVVAARPPCQARSSLRDVARGLDRSRALSRQRGRARQLARHVVAAPPRAAAACRAGSLTRLGRRVARERALARRHLVEHTPSEKMSLR